MPSKLYETSFFFYFLTPAHLYVKTGVRLINDDVVSMSIEGVDVIVNVIVDVISEGRDLDAMNMIHVDAGELRLYRDGPVRPNGHQHVVVGGAAGYSDT